MFLCPCVDYDLTISTHNLLLKGFFTILQLGIFFVNRGREKNEPKVLFPLHQLQEKEFLITG